MSLSSLKHNIYSTTTDVTVEAKFNVMQATFIILQFKPLESEDILLMGQKVTHSLYNRYFDQSLKVYGFFHYIPILYM